MQIAVLELANVGNYVQMDEKVHDLVLEAMQLIVVERCLLNCPIASNIKEYMETESYQ